MISATRMLCQKYTDLTDAEISYLESYGALLPALANAEQADVFIDCRTVSGRSAIVVCEAKPQTVPSNYRSSILGMLIHWRDEPAVDRSFRLAVPTSGVRAVSMPEDRRIVQSVEPLFYEGRLIGVLIYERPALAAEEPPPAGEREAEQASGALDWAAVSPCLDDAVLFLDEEDRVCGFNPAATALYRRMGYIGTLAGMPVNNIQPAALSECDQDGHETALANRVLQYQRLPLSSGQARAALIIHDLTRQRQLEEELALQRTALQELRHRMKTTFRCSPTSPGAGVVIRPSPRRCRPPFWIRPTGCSPWPPRWTASYRSPGRRSPSFRFWSRSAGTCSRPSCPPPAVSPSTWAARTSLCPRTAPPRWPWWSTSWCRTP